MKAIIDFIKDVFKERTIYDSLEAYIVAGNPQGPEDVDRLEREYWDKNHRVSYFDRCI